MTPTVPQGVPRMQRRCTGFSLMELLLAAAFGALLVTATATMSGSFGQTVAQLERDSVDSYEVALARITRDVRYAWWSKVPTRGSLQVADTDNAVTEYFIVGNSLLVRRPDGAEGAVITGLSAVNFEADSLRRLREDRAVSVSRRVHGVAVPAAVSGSIELVPGNALALAFSTGSNVGPLTASGVDDRVINYLPDRLDLYLARASLNGLLHVEIYPARAPGDARPRPGSTALASFDVGLRLLPLGVILIPPTNPFDLSTGAFLAPLTMTSLAIPSMTGRLQPGTAYCVVLSVTGSGSLGLVGGWGSAVGAHRGVVFRHAAANPWTDLPAVVPAGVYGEVVQTATEATNVVQQVRVKLTNSEGVEHLGSATVSGQVLVDDPWLGAIPGESPTLP